MKRNSLLVATLFVTLIAGAQSINLHMNNGEVIKYRSSEVDYIDFSENSETETYTSCPDGNHPHMIELGLPSGTKWACCNVGASSPEQYGCYFAWGETSEKSSYTSDNYLDGKGTSYNIGKGIAGTLYDAATANWGSPWVMPNKEQMEELMNNCTSEWTTENGVNGRRFTGPNGASIFLPAAGYRWRDSVYGACMYGNGWSSTLGESYTDIAWGLYFDNWDVREGYDGRYYGRSVRPVFNGQGGDSGNGPGTISGNTITVKAIDFGVANGVALGTQTLADGTKLVFDGGGNSNAPKYYNTSSGINIRVYPKNTLTITASKNIQKVVFICDEYQGITYNASEDIAASPGTVTLDGKFVTISSISSKSTTITNTSFTTGLPSQIRIISIEITYAD